MSVLSHTEYNTRGSPGLRIRVQIDWINLQDKTTFASDDLAKKKRLRIRLFSSEKRDLDPTDKLTPKIAGALVHIDRSQTKP